MPGVSGIVTVADEELLSSNCVNVQMLRCLLWTSDVTIRQEAFSTVLPTEVRYHSIVLEETHQLSLQGQRVSKDVRVEQSFVPVSGVTSR